MARTVCRLLAALLLTIACGQLDHLVFESGDNCRWISAARAQGNLYPPGYQAGAAGDYGLPTSSTPGGGTVPPVTGSYGPLPPATPVNPTRPAGWPGSPPDQANEPPQGARYAPAAPGAPVAPPVAAPKKNLKEPPYEPAAIMARVGSEVVQATEMLPSMHQTLDAFVAKLGDDWKKAPEEVRQERLNQWQRELAERTLDDLIKIKLLLAEVKSTVPAEALKKNEDRIRRDFNENELKRLMMQYKATSVIDLENKLRACGGSLDSQRNLYVQRYMAISWLRQQVKDQKEPTHEQMVTYYREHAPDWERPARARWEQLTARFDKFESKEAARGALGRWGNEVFKGAPLAQVAKAHSHDFSAEEGGQYDWTTKGSLRSTAIEAAVFALPVGTLSQIIEDVDGVHIVRVLEREDQRQIPFSEVQAEVIKRLKEGDQQQNMNAYLAKLRKHTPVHSVFESEDAAVANRPSDPPR